MRLYWLRSEYTRSIWLNLGRVTFYILTFSPRWCSIAFMNSWIPTFRLIRLYSRTLYWAASSMRSTAHSKAYTTILLVYDLNIATILQAWRTISSIQLWLTLDIRARLLKCLTDGHVSLRRHKIIRLICIESLIPSLRYRSRPRLHNWFIRLSKI